MSEVGIAGTRPGADYVTPGKYRDHRELTTISNTRNKTQLYN
jgi:hypothetical protein